MPASVSSIRTIPAVSIMPGDWLLQAERLGPVSPMKITTVAIDPERRNVTLVGHGDCGERVVTLLRDDEVRVERPEPGQRPYSVEDLDEALATLFRPEPAGA